MKGTAMLVGFLLSSLPLFGNDCKPLNDKTKESVLSYVSRRWNMGAASQLTLRDEDVVRDTCYRKVTVDGVALKFPFTIFLSPDQRFLTVSLLDTLVSPEEETREETERINGLLLADPSPRRGLPSAPITIVEFSDFACPYCKRFDDWVTALPTESRTKFSLIYKHLPLAKHPWAHEAAAIAACASLQSPDAFWTFHKFFFQQQTNLSVDNIRKSVTEFAPNAPSINTSELLSCVEEHRSETLVTRDAELARKLRVSATPTIFVNGVRAGPLHTVDDLKVLIGQAQQSNPGPPDITPRH
jgi:protein-disulfide isomerase